MTTATMTPEQIEAFERLKTQGVPLTTENLADEPVQSVQPQSLYASMEMMLAVSYTHLTLPTKRIV